MGHMDNDDDKHTVTVYTEHGSEVFPSCTEVIPNDRELVFNDSTGKRHELYGLSYHIVKE